MSGPATFRVKHLPDFEVSWDDSPDVEAGKRRWAAESTKRFLAAQIAVGTVDQAMMAALQVNHSHMRAACLARNLLVVDEVHASDPYMRVILEALLNAHLDAGGYALLMSATLGSAARRQWLLRPKTGKRFAIASRSVRPSKIAYPCGQHFRRAVVEHIVTGRQARTTQKKVAIYRCESRQCTNSIT